MRTLLSIMSTLTNIFHTLIAKIIHLFIPDANDKMLHFITIGVISLILFIFVNLVFKKLAEYSIELISFIFTFTVIVVLSFAIEIQQYVTGSGNMEFDDIAYGLFGCILAILFWIAFSFAIRYFKRK